MSWLSKALGKVKDVALPVIGTALGGPLGGALGGLAAGAIGHGKPTVGTVATGGALGLGAGLLGGTSVGKSVLGGAESLLGGGTADPWQAAHGGGGGWENILKTVGGGLLKVAPAALGAYGAIEGAKQAAHGQDLQTQALDYAKQRDAELAPLRTAGLSAAMNAFQHPVTPYDAVGGYVDAGNPYSRTPAGGPGTMPAAAPGAAPPALSPAMLAALGGSLGGVVPLLPRTAKRRTG
jgi:hypothetical protein